MTSGTFFIYAPLRYLLILFLNMFTVLAFSKSVVQLIKSFIVLCENEYVLIYNLHSSFTDVSSCPLVIVASISEKNDCCINIVFFGVMHN